MYVWCFYVLNNVGLGFGLCNSNMWMKWKYLVVFFIKKIYDFFFGEKGNSVLYVLCGCKFVFNFC